jgi:SPP1 gp7 family putative phage head morphogenesis protein
MVKTPNIFSFFRTTPTKAAAIDQSPIALIGKGSSGTEIYSGYFNEEYLSKLFAEKGIKLFDEMRRSDGQVKMLLSSIKNPIKSASWEVEAAGEEEIDYEIRDFVHYVLFKNLGNLKGTKRKTFEEFIAEALTVIEFGFSLFEVVHKVVKNDKNYGDFIGIEDFGFRHQRSILEWLLNEDGSIKAVRQLVNGDLGRDVYIPGQHCLVFSMDKEGDNYEGISMLRSCYGAWFRKNIYRKLQAIGIERTAKGVPIGTVSPEAKSAPDYAAQLTAFQELVDRLSAHEKNGVVLGAGFDIKEFKMKYDSDSTQKAIDSENIEMSKAFLANFMELGLQGNSGSFALGTDLSDIFLNGIQYIGDMICARVNLEIIEPIVKAKYGEQDNYPKLKVTGINDKAGKELAEIVTSLISSKGIQASTRLQRYLHKLYKLPDIDEDIALKDDERFLNPPEPTVPFGQPSQQFNEKKNCGHDHADLIKGEVTFQLSEVEREAFPVSAKIEDYAADLNNFMQKSLKSRADQMLSEMKTIINKDDGDTRSKVLAVAMPKSKVYITALEEWAAKVVDQTFGDTVKEVGLKKKDVQFAENLKKAPKKLRDKLIKLTVLTATYQDSDIEKAVYFSFNENFETLTPPKLIKEMTGAADRYFEKGTIETAAVNMASNVVNSTRKETFLTPEVAEEVESFVFMNPDPVSPICRSLNGKVFSKEEFETSSLTPPLHHNCKSYIKAQTAGASGNKPITGLKIEGSKEEVEQILRSKTL